jgi:hypothetical protein
MNVDRAAELYVAGWTLRRIGAELGVDHRTVAVRLHRAGVTMRRGGRPRCEVDMQRILDLRDQGLTAVAAQVGMSVSGVWARYYRARPTKRADASVSTAPVRMIPGRGAVAADLARAVHVPVRLGDSARQVNHLVLVRSDAEAGLDQVLATATCKPPAADQPARKLELSLTTLGTAARNIDVDLLSAEQAGHLAAILQASVADLTRLARRLERRAGDARHTSKPPTGSEAPAIYKSGEANALSGVRGLTRGDATYPRMYLDEHAG